MKLIFSHSLLDDRMKSALKLVQTWIFLFSKALKWNGGYVTGVTLLAHYFEIPQMSNIFNSNPKLGHNKVCWHLKDCWKVVWSIPDLPTLRFFSFIMGILLAIFLAKRLPFLTLKMSYLSVWYPKLSFLSKHHLLELNWLHCVIK